jgi:hypothetical protein
MQILRIFFFAGWEAKIWPCFEISRLFSCQFDGDNQWTVGAWHAKLRIEISYTARADPVANRHKWRIGHESVATQPTFLQLVRQKNCQTSYYIF